MLVASSQPLDQYIVRNPEFFLGASPEQARIAPDQLLILLDHVRCAAFELPFSRGESFGGEPLEELLEYLCREGVLHQESGRWHWMADSYPANSVSLRSVAEGNFVVIDTSEGRQDVIAEVDFHSAPMTIYQGAIYLIQSRPYQVERLDWEGRKAFVTQTRADYYTDAIDYTRLKILEQFDTMAGNSASSHHGEVHLVRRIAGYKKIRYYSHENVGFGQIRLPDQEMHTTSAWWRIDPKRLEQAFPNRQQALDGFLGAGHAIHQVAALLMLSEPSDIGRAVGDGDSRWFATVGSQGRGHLLNPEGKPLEVEQLGQFAPALFLYDNYPGGIGISEPLYQRSSEVIRRSLELVAQCDCRSGCPGCVGPILASDEQRGFSPKEAALRVMALLGNES